MLLFLGLSHRLTPLPLRERCAVAAEERDQVRVHLHQQLGPVVLLSTCGRLELYIDTDREPGAVRREALAWLAARAQTSFDEVALSAETAEGEDALRRLVQVACGLESALEGEDEVLGQVRRAWLDAARGGTLSPALDTAFRLAVRTGRQARRFGRGDAWTSLADTAAAHAGDAVAYLPSPRVLIAGTGPMGMRAALALRERFGPRLDLVMAGRTPERVIAHAAQAGARSLTLTEMPAAFAEVDAAVVALRTRAPLVLAGEIAPRAADRPLMIVDLSLPRAVDPGVGALPGISLHDVDHLTGGDRRHVRWTAEDRARVERLVARAVCEFSSLRGRSDAMTTLTTLRLQADAVRQAQLARTLRRLPHLDDQSRWVVDALTRAIVNRLLHEPTMRLKTDAGDHAATQVRELFGLTSDARGDT